MFEEKYIDELRPTFYRKLIVLFIVLMLGFAHKLYDFEQYFIDSHKPVKYPAKVYKELSSLKDKKI
ncbi:MAG: hypothetical protein NW207_05950 [Cytophagales bacterium]|nr:hypothetical protein [Cytophagales bacterium]